MGSRSNAVIRGGLVTFRQEERFLDSLYRQITVQVFVFNFFRFGYVGFGSRADV